MAQTEIIEGEPIKKHHFFLFIFILFLLVLLYLIYTSFYDGFGKNKFTGNIIKEKFTKGDKNITAHTITGELNVPGEIKISSKIKKLVLSVNNPTIIIIGDQKIELKKDSILVIDEYNGKLVLDENKISELSGKSKEVLINNIPIRKKSGSEIKIRNEEEFNYRSIEIKEIYLSSFSYPVNGNLIMDGEKIIVNLDNEKIDIKDFKGDLEISQRKIKINGNFEKFDLNDILKTKALNRS